MKRIPNTAEVYGAFRARDRVQSSELIYLKPENSFFSSFQ